MQAGRRPTGTEQQTLWAHVYALGDRSDVAAWQEAWTHLVDRYRPYLLAIARRSLVKVPSLGDVDHNAQEVVDAFLARCLEGDVLSRADPDRGRFRVFIRVVLRRFTRDWIDGRMARKRMPPGGSASLDPERHPEPPCPREAVDELDAAWARLLLEDALVRVGHRSETNQRVMRLFIESGRLDDESLAAAIDKQERQVKVTVHRARSMFAEELWQAIKQTVSDPESLELERLAFQPYLAGYLDRDKHPSFFGLP